MGVRTDTAAPPEICMRESASVTRPTHIKYTRDVLFNIRNVVMSEIAGICFDLDILRQQGILSATTDPATCRIRRKRLQKRWHKRKQQGRRAGINTRLKANSTRQVVLSVLLSIVRSQRSLDDC